MKHYCVTIPEKHLHQVEKFYVVWLCRLREKSHFLQTRAWKARAGASVKMLSEAGGRLFEDQLFGATLRTESEGLMQCTCGLLIVTHYSTRPKRASPHPIQIKKLQVWYNEDKPLSQADAGSKPSSQAHWPLLVQTWSIRTEWQTFPVIMIEQREPSRAVRIRSITRYT